MSVLGDIATTPEQRTANRLRALEERVRHLEQSRVPIIQGAPSATAIDGSMVGDGTNNRLWLRVDGSWLYTQLS